ncbi:MAG: V-type ATPase subunit [Clostridia bacterium]|nr:V-type ATPase subunit [Clostridia bacterium]
MADYTYTNAYISAKETSILNRDALARITSDSADALRLLAQTGYGGGEGGSAGELADRELSQLRAFIMSALPDTLYPLLILPYDAHNLKVLLKCRVSGADPAPYLYDNTMFDTEIAAACCRGGEFSLLSDTIADGLNAAYDDGRLTAPFSISAECDRAFYRDISLRSKKAIQPVSDYVTAEADGKNLLTFYRAKRIGLSADDFKALLLPGGSVSGDVFTGAYASNAEDLRAYTFGLDCHDAFSAAAEAAGRSLSEAAGVLDDYSLSKLLPFRYEPSSPVPVFIYFKKKTAEARLVREAFAGNGGRNG